jgi:hypothetical protein
MRLRLFLFWAFYSRPDLRITPRHEQSHTIQQRLRPHFNPFARTWSWRPAAATTNGLHALSKGNYTESSHYCRTLPLAVHTGSHPDAPLEVCPSPESRLQLATKFTKTARFHRWNCGHATAWGDHAKCLQTQHCSSAFVAQQHKVMAGNLLDAHVAFAREPARSQHRAWLPNTNFRDAFAVQAGAR